VDNFVSKCLVIWSISCIRGSPPSLPPHIPPAPRQKRGSNIRMNLFSKKNFQVFFFQNFGPPLSSGYPHPEDPLCRVVIPILVKDPFSKHDPLFILKPFFKKISGENFIPKYRPFKRCLIATHCRDICRDKMFTVVSLL
jgi:hypothetical protein